jgi:heat shock protein HslJ
MRFVMLSLLSLIPACQGDETLRAYGAADRIWTLTEIDGHPFTAEATLTFPAEGTIAGAAPCNKYSASMTVPYPWFEAGPIRATKMACADLKAESHFFQALDAMTLSEVLGDILILSTPEGRKMVFRGDV